MSHLCDCEDKGVMEYFTNDHYIFQEIQSFQTMAGQLSERYACFSLLFSGLDTQGKDVQTADNPNGFKMYVAQIQGI